VKAATLTGSGPAGRAVASSAGENLKKTVLELGGSDPFVVLDDADVEAAAETGAWARNQNGGQSCIAGKRFVVHTDVYDEFVDRFVDEFESLTVGDPMDEETDVGPQSRPDLLEELDEQVQESIEAGATVLTGGEPMDREGSYYPPTILADVPTAVRSTPRRRSAPSPRCTRSRTRRPPSNSRTTRSSASVGASGPRTASAASASPSASRLAASTSTSRSSPTPRAVRRHR